MSSWCREGSASSLARLVLVALPFCLHACALPAGVKGTPAPYIVSAPRTLFYRMDPALNAEADALLLRGQKLLVARKQYGYSQVQLADGQRGYVLTGDVAIAPPEAIRIADSASSTKMADARRRGRRRAIVQPGPDPFFDVNDLPFPVESGRVENSANQSLFQTGEVNGVSPRLRMGPRPRP